MVTFDIASKNAAVSTYFVNLLDDFLFNSNQVTEQEDGRERCRNEIFYILLDILYLPVCNQAWIQILILLSIPP